MTLTQSGPQAGPATPADAARQTLDRARDHLLGLQDPAGWWQGELETNVTMDAEDLLLREFLGIRTDEQTAAAARWIRSKQRDDGTWANFHRGPADLSTTVEAYCALRLAGAHADEPHMMTSARWIREQGGIEATRVFTRIWLAMFGQWSWESLPVIPPELIYLPAWFPLNVYDWACWARQTIVPLSVVGALRPCQPLPFGLDELRTGAKPKSAKGDPWAVMFEGLDKALHVYEKRAVGARWARNPGKAVRRAALRRCADWIIARQEKDGCWGGIQPPWVYSLIALHLLGWGLDHPVIARGIAALDRFTITEQTSDGPIRRLEACQSPVWDTVLAMNALADAGADLHHPAMSRAADWVLGEEIHGPGDWQVRRPDLAPGGWAFEFDNDGYPDTDDTAEVVLALRKCWPERRPTAGLDWPERRPTAGLDWPGRRPTAGLDWPGRRPTAGPGGRAEQAEAAIRRGVRWMAGMQSKDGGWGAFDADNTRYLVNKLPFCDFGAVIDPPSADVTAHIVEALAAEGMAATKAARRGVAWLLKAQEPDGSWFGRWGANYVYGTGAVLPALIDAGVKPGKPCIRAAVRWLEEHQNDDGGWGEDLRSYDDPSLAGQGESTASQTAWALMGLLAAEGPDAVHSKVVQRGIEWLAQTQLDNGTWDEPLYTGTGFPGDFYINYHLYRLVFPISALGRYLRIAEQA